MLEMLPRARRDDGLRAAGDAAGDLGARLPDAFLVGFLAGFFAAAVGFLALPAAVLDVLAMVMLSMEAAKCLLMAVG